MSKIAHRGFHIITQGDIGNDGEFAYRWKIVKLEPRLTDISSDFEFASESDAETAAISYIATELSNVE